MPISPYTLSPNPGLMYLTPSTIESLETIRWMIDDKQGLAAIFGDAGYGKSTLLRWLMAEYADESLYTTSLMTRVDFATPFAFTRQLAHGFGIEAKRSMSAQNDALENFLLQEHIAGRTVIVFMDEGQSLTSFLLEVIRALLNFETDDCKLIQVVIAGQLDLLDRIRLKKNKALASRIFSPVAIQPLRENEVAEMIAFRCSRARVECPFTADAISRIFQRVGGNPREILKTCARASKQFPAQPIVAEQIEVCLERAPRVLAAS